MIMFSILYGLNGLYTTDKENQDNRVYIKIEKYSLSLSLL